MHFFSGIIKMKCAEIKKKMKSLQFCSNRGAPHHDWIQNNLLIFSPCCPTNHFPPRVTAQKEAFPFIAKAEIKVHQ